MEHQLRELLDRAARIEENTKSIKENQKDQEERIRSLEKKWWSSLGAFGLAVVSFFKSFFIHG